TTTIYVTHDQIEAMTMADRIVVMRDGKVEQVGRPLDLYDRPANIFVAGFIGSPAMNFIKGRISGDVLVTNASAIALAGVAASLDGRDVVLGVRPEHLEHDPDGFEAEVVVVEPMGADTQINARIGETELVCIVHDRLLPRPGESLKLRIQPGKHHFFDPE